MINKNNPLSLSNLISLIKDTIDDKFERQNYWVIAEISNLKLNNGHYYFDCVEKNKDNADIVAKISCKIWKYNVHHVKNFESCTGQILTNDIEVLLCVSIYFHSVHGLSLIVNDIDTNYTIGLLAKEKEKTLQKLCNLNPDKIQFIDGVYKTP
jgi:exodeoxyribonuclease VII large subunit